MSSCHSESSPMFQPAMRIISTITNSNPATVTTTIDHDYISGEIVRLIIPKGFGMPQADKKYGEITVTGTDTFTIDIDTTHFDPFSPPSPLPDAFTCAQTIPIGEVASILSGATKNVSRIGER